MPLPVADLSVVIPVHNAASTIADVVAGLLSTTRVAVEVVLVDDGSSDGSDAIMDDLAGQHERVTALHLERNVGAGRARNHGFKLVEGRYTLFFDADDIPHVDAIDAIVPQLDVTGADVAFGTYWYQRGEHAPHSRMNDFDLQVWDEMMPSEQVFHVTTLDRVSRLLGFTNYPWNKVIRTSTYRASELRFGSGIVNNDILGHWHTMLFADQVLLADMQMCTHVVDPRGSNLTNRHARERLALFDAFNETYDLLESRPDLRNRYSHHYWSFVLRTAGWASERIRGDVKEQFNLGLQQLLLRMNLADFARLRLKRDPTLADQILEGALR